MENLFERLGENLKSYIDDEDLQKLNKENIKKLKSRHSDTKKNSECLHNKRSTSSKINKNEKGIPAHLIADFKILGLCANESFEACKKAHKKLLHKYHPDKYPDNSRSQLAATRATVRLYEAFGRIKKWFSESEDKQPSNIRH